MTFDILITFPNDDTHSTEFSLYVYVSLLEKPSWKLTLEHLQQLKKNCLSADSVGPYVISCQMFVKSEFPLNSALVGESDQKKLGWHFFRNL